MDLFPAVKYVVAKEDMEHVRAYVVGMIWMSWPKGQDMMLFEMSNVALDVISAINDGNPIIADPKIASLVAAVKLFFAKPVKYDNQGKQENARRFRDGTSNIISTTVNSYLPKPDPMRGNYVDIKVIMNMDDAVKSSSEFKNPGFVVTMANKAGNFVQHHYLKMNENSVVDTAEYARENISPGDEERLTMFTAAHLNDAQKLRDLLETTIIARWRKLDYDNV